MHSKRWFDVGSPSFSAFLCDTVASVCEGCMCHLKGFVVRCSDGMVPCKPGLNCAVPEHSKGGWCGYQRVAVSFIRLSHTEEERREVGKLSEHEPFSFSCLKKENLENRISKFDLFLKFCSLPKAWITSLASRNVTAASFPFSCSCYMLLGTHLSNRTVFGPINVQLHS